MRKQVFRALAALAVAATPALAGSPDGGGEGAGQGSRRAVAAAPPTRRGPAGLFNCSFREQRTKLERKNCGTIRY